MKRQISVNLKIAMAEKGVTQGSLANHLGVSRSLVAYWCNGGTIADEDQFNAVCEYLDVPADLLLEEIPIYKAEGEDDQKAAFAKNLKRALAMSAYTQSSLAKELGVSKPCVYAWCNGSRTPGINKIKRICDCLGITRQELFGPEGFEKETMPPDEISLINAYRKLNEFGKYKVIGYVQDMLEIRKYTT